MIEAPYRLHGGSLNIWIILILGGMCGEEFATGVEFICTCLGIFSLCLC